MKHIKFKTCIIGLATVVLSVLGLLAYEKPENVQAAARTYTIYSYSDYAELINLSHYLLKAGDTVKLGANINLSTGQAFVISRNITFDGNGKTIKYTGTKYSKGNGKQLFVIANKTVTIKNLIIDANGGVDICLSNNGSSKLTLSGTCKFYNALATEIIFNSTSNQGNTITIPEGSTVNVSGLNNTNTSNGIGTGYDGGSQNQRKYGTINVNGTLTIYNKALAGICGASDTTINFGTNSSAKISTCMAGGVKTFGGTVNLRNAEIYKGNIGVYVGSSHIKSTNTYYYGKLNMYAGTKIYNNNTYGLYVSNKCTAAIGGAVITGSSTYENSEKVTSYGIYIESDATVTNNGGTIKHIVNNGVRNNGTFNMKGGSIVFIDGNAVYNSGTFTMSDGIIEQTKGYAVYNTDKFTMNGGTFADTTIKGTYGTVYQNGTMTATSAVAGYIYLASDIRYVTTNKSTNTLKIRPNVYTDERVVIKTFSAAYAGKQAAGMLYEKTGWKLKASGSDVVICDEYTITVKKGTGIAKVTGDGTHHYGDKVTLTATLTTGFGNAKWDDGTVGISREITVTKDATYSVESTINHSTITIYPNGGIWNGSSDAMTYTQAFNTTLDIPDPVISDIKITYDATGGTVFKTEDICKKSFKEWKQSNPFYCGRLDAAENGGYIFKFGSFDGAKGSITAQYNITPVTLINPVRVGYTFIGWYTQKDGGTYVGKCNDTYVPKENMTLYAHWRINSYTVKFNTNPKSITEKNVYGDKISTDPTGSVNSIKVEYGGKAIMPNGATIRRTGYKLVGWDVSPSAKTPEFKTGSTLDHLSLTSEDKATVTLYAIWEPVTYTMTYDMNLADTKKFNDDTVRFDETFVLSNIPKRAGYNFYGWQITSGASYGAYKNETDTNPDNKNVVRYKINDSLVNVRSTSGTVTLCAVWEHVRLDVNKTVEWSGVPMDDTDMYIYYSNTPYYSSIGSYTAKSGEYVGYYVNTNVSETWPVNRVATITSQGRTYEISGYGYDVITPDGNVTSVTTSTSAGTKSGTNTISISKNNHILVIPWVYVSDTWNDKNNAASTKKTKIYDTNGYISVIGDCTPPSMQGDEVLKDIVGLDRGEFSTYPVSLYAADGDAGSGIMDNDKWTYVNVINAENNNNVMATLDKSGNVNDIYGRLSIFRWASFDLMEKDELADNIFNGNYSVSYNVADNVGNAIKKTIDSGVFGLTATLTDKEDKVQDEMLRGGLIKIHVKTYGYTNALEFAFPKEWYIDEEFPVYVFWGDLETGSGKDFTAITKDYMYVRPGNDSDGIWEQDFYFIIPLYAESGMSDIKVRAYKGDVEVDGLYNIIVNDKDSLKEKILERIVSVNVSKNSVLSRLREHIVSVGNRSLDSGKE